MRNSALSLFGTFFVIHLEVGKDTKNLKHQNKYWLTMADFVELADQYNAKLTLQFNPQWAEYILQDKKRFHILKKWQEKGHEIALHHHGYDHANWNGFTNREGINDDSRYRGSVNDMMKLMNQISYPYELLSGTVTDDQYDYPEGIKYDTQGIRIHHARTKPKKVILGDRIVNQVGMAFLSFKGNIERFRQDYMKSESDEIFGVVTHEADFAKNPAIIEKWFKFIKSRSDKIETVSKIIYDYQKAYVIEWSDDPLTFTKDIKCKI